MKGSPTERGERDPQRDVPQLSERDGPQRDEDPRKDGEEPHTDVGRPHC